MEKTREQLAVDAIRILSVDAVQRANSGHPGAPMGMADLAVVLWSRFLRVDPTDPTWRDRDRFVLSNGHASMLLYSLLHFSGFPVSMEDIKGFRQIDSRAAGHPEVEVPAGIETTTGPLGQGFSTGVGMAIAEAHLRSVFGPDLIDHQVFGFVSDGDLMEGISAEAASLAGHLGLGKLVYAYDDNEITIDGSTDLAFSDASQRRFDAYGWQTAEVDGHDRAAIADAIESAIAEEARPSLIVAKTHIAYGSPNKQDSASSHGSPLGDDEIALVRERFGWELPPFEIPDDVYSFFDDGLERGKAARRAWAQRRDLAFAEDRALATRWESYYAPGPAHLAVPDYEAGSSVATRKASGAVLQQAAAQVPGLIGGSADLTPSNNSQIDGSADFSAKDTGGRNLKFGVREHAMGAAVNGITLHGGLRGYGATFLTFSDYMRPAVRLAALMGVPSIFVWTHDSVFLGEDGPTHQPIEHVASLRAMPNLWVVRPADPAEVAVGWEMAINRVDGPTALVLTRQGLPVPASPPDPNLVRRGGYIRREGNDAVIVATGSEVWLAERAAELLEADGASLRVVSMPCREVFEAQSDAYRTAVLGEGLPVASLEAAATFGWESVTGRDGLRMGIDRFGVSAPASAIAEAWGFTPEAVAARVGEWLDG